MKRTKKWVIVVGGAVTVALVAIATRLFGSPSLEPCAALMMQPSAPDAPGLRAQFFGVSTVLISDGQTSLMVDGFFSRPGLLRLLLGRIEPDEKRIDAALCQGHVSKLDAVLVAHSHFDHALDSASVARKTEALLVGSKPVTDNARGKGLAGNRLRTIGEVDQPLQLGEFQVSFFESPHSPPPPGIIPKLLQRLAQQAGDIASDEKNYVFLLQHPRGNILIVPSANYHSELFKDKDVQADVVFLSIGTLGKLSDGFICNYWNKMVRTTGAKLVIPIHWDNSVHPLNKNKPLKPSPYLFDDMGRAMSRLQDLAQAVEIQLMPVFDPVALPASAPRSQ
jgi:L-ascorbate metabolism protein UlaG (beta-lactamase superfamily)